MRKGGNERRKEGDIEAWSNGWLDRWMIEGGRECGRGKWRDGWIERGSKGGKEG